MESVIRSSYIRHVLSEVDRLKPNYVVITGDIFNHGFVEECTDSDRIARYFRKLNEDLSSTDVPYRIYAVCGNHDPLPTDPALKRFLEKADIRLLKDEIVHLPEFDLAGRDSNHMDHRAPLKDWLKADRPLVLLDHYPDGMQEAAESGVSLFLCGHTHGGQCFPCNLLIRKRYSKKKGMVRGISQHGKMTAIVSLGTGFFQIPIRVGTDSEIVSIDLSI